jgi:hypothetical protein
MYSVYPYARVKRSGVKYKSLGALGSRNGFNGTAFYYIYLNLFFYMRRVYILYSCVPSFNRVLKLIYGEEGKT